MNIGHMQEVGASLCDAVLQFSISENLIKDYSIVPTAIKIKKDKKSDIEKVTDIENDRKGIEKNNETDNIYNDMKNNVDVVIKTFQDEKEIDKGISKIENTATFVKKERTSSLFFSPPVCVGDMGAGGNIPVQRNILSDIRICKSIVFLSFILIPFFFHYLYPFFPKILFCSQHFI